MPADAKRESLSNIPHLPVVGGAGIRFGHDHPARLMVSFLPEPARTGVTELCRFGTRGWSSPFQRLTGYAQRRRFAGLIFTLSGPIVSSALSGLVSG